MRYSKLRATVRTLCGKMPSIYFLRSGRTMHAITLEAARYLAIGGAIHGAVIKSVHGRKWAIALLGKVDYMLRSEPLRLRSSKSAILD